MRAVDHELVILSPEKTILGYRLAGIGSRVWAQVIDLGLILLAMIGLGAAAGRLPFIPPNVIGGIMAVSFILFFFLYFILLEGFWNGQTIGKRALGIRVRMADGTPITFFASVGRNLVRIGDFYPAFYFAGFLAVICNPRSQRFGDLVAGTIVAYEKRPKGVQMAAPHTAGLHFFEDKVGELKGMTIEEYLALRRLCDRFPELPRNIQERMLQEIWFPIARRRGVPDMMDVHPLYLAEAAVMRFGREHGLL